MTLIEVCSLILIFVHTHGSKTVNVTNKAEYKLPESVSNESTSAYAGFGPGDQSWGFTEVRPGANLFHWMLYANGQRSHAEDKPLILWLQGGPGVSGTGVGNFLEIGPLDHELKPRNTTWVPYANLIFIDSPVGTGFSYADNSTMYCTTNKQIVADLIQWTKEFMMRNKEFENTPFYIFTESYGGKIGPTYAYELYKEIEIGSLKMNLKSLAIGSGFVDPEQTINAYPGYMLNHGMIDIKDAESLNSLAKKLSESIKSEKYVTAFDYFYKMTMFSIRLTGKNYNLYNIDQQYKRLDEYGLDDLMMDSVKKALKLPQNVEYNLENKKVFKVLENELMKSAVKWVEKLLNETNVNIVVYNGDLDLIVNVVGTMGWINKLRWPGATVYKAAERKGVPGEWNGYVKRHDRLTMWWVSKCGHMVSIDNPKAMLTILKDVLELQKINYRAPVTFSQYVDV